MRVIETLLEGKTSVEKDCEDGFVICEDGIAVIDGATSSSRRLNGKKSGRVAMEVLRDGFPALADEPDPVVLLGKLSALLRESRASAGQELGPEWCPRASIVFYQRGYRRIVSYGDCQAIINGRLLTSQKLIDVENAEIRCRALKGALAGGATVEELRRNDIGRAAIQERLSRQHAYENRPGRYGFPVMNGERPLAEMVRTWAVCPGDEVVLASDGYPALRPTLAASEAELAGILQRDPLCISENPQTKGVAPGQRSYDDRCYVRMVA